MKNECSLIKDILPLYIENMLNADSIEFVEEHIPRCDNCKKELELLKSDISLEHSNQVADSPIRVMRNIKLSIQKNAYLLV